MTQNVPSYGIERVNAKLKSARMPIAALKVAARGDARK